MRITEAKQVQNEISHVFLGHVSSGDFDGRSVTDLRAAGCFPAPLQAMVTSYAFVDLILEADGDLARIPEFLRPGASHELNATTLSLQDRTLSSRDIRLLDRRMPNLREVNLSGSTIDGMPCFFHSKIRAHFPNHPKIKFVASIEQTIRRSLPIALVEVQRKIERQSFINRVNPFSQYRQLKADEETMQAAQNPGYMDSGSFVEVIALLENLREHRLQMVAQIIIGIKNKEGSTETRAVIKNLLELRELRKQLEIAKRDSSRVFKLFETIFRENGSFMQLYEEDTTEEIRRRASEDIQAARDNGALSEERYQSLLPFTNIPTGFQLQINITE